MMGEGAPCSSETPAIAAGRALPKHSGRGIVSKEKKMLCGGRGPEGPRGLKTLGTSIRVVEDIAYIT